MINFRYHAVSLTAVLLALAAGVVLGAGVLDTASSDEGGDATTSADPAVASFESGYAGRTAGSLLGDSLDGQSVVVLTTAGADAGDVRGVGSAIEQAGGEVVGQVELTSKLLDPAGRQFAEGVAQQVGEDVPGISADGDGYARIGAALGRALVADETADLDEGAGTLRSAFVEGDLIDLVDEPSQLATMAVVVTGPRSSTSADQGVALAGLSAAIDAAGNGAVVAGPASSSTSGGFVAAVRDGEETGSVSTVDVVDSAAGRVVVALALGREADDESGAWGTSRSGDGAVPTS